MWTTILACFVTVAVIGLFGWKRRKAIPSCPWSVSVIDNAIVVSDGQGIERSLPIAHLRQVVVATDDSGPWGDDVVFLLYSAEPDPVALFPLEANGEAAFVDWLLTQPGHRANELTKAMSSTAVARFVVYEADG